MEVKGTEEFIAASDEFYGHLAKLIRLEIKADCSDIDKLRELSEIIKINSSSMKSQEEKPKGKLSPSEKIKKRSSTGEQVSV